MLPGLGVPLTGPAPRARPPLPVAWPFADGEGVRGHVALVWGMRSFMSEQKPGLRSSPCETSLACDVPPFPKTASSRRPRASYVLPEKSQAHDRKRIGRRGPGRGPPRGLAGRRSSRVPSWGARVITGSRCLLCSLAVRLPGPVINTWQVPATCVRWSLASRVFLNYAWHGARCS